MNAQLRAATRTGCAAHWFCEAVLEFSSWGYRASNNDDAGLRVCEAGGCDGAGVWDHDSGSMNVQPHWYAVPAIAQHATWDNAQQRIVVLCTECMNNEQQVLPPTQQKGEDR